MTSFNAIYNKAKNHLDSGKVTILSLDVFDTIFHRTCPPNAVLDAVNHFIVKECEKLSHFIDYDTVSWARGEAYLRCANHNAVNDLDQETHVDDFFPLWIELLGLDSSYVNDLASKVLDHELYLEEQVLRPDPGMAQLIQYAFERDIKVIYCSDMYLPARFVDSMLEKAGLLKFFKGRYISSEIKLLKRTGNLFVHILRNEGEKPKNFLHIGDNVVSDYVNSKSHGMKAIWLNDSQYQSRRYSLEYDHLNLHNPASFPFLLSEQGRFDTTTKNPSYFVGRNALGPIYTSFIIDVKHKAKELDVEKVFFLAREGYALKKIYDHLTHNDDQAPEGCYIAGSRILSFLYSVDNGIGLRHLADIFSNTNTYTVANLLAPFGVDPVILNDTCQRYGIQSDAVLPPGFLEWPPFIRILEDKLLNEKILERIQEHRELYTHYLTKAGLIGKSKVMVVDVGWGGQIQDNLFRGLQICDSAPDLMVGCYLALNEKAHQRKQPNNWKHATHADKGFMEWNAYSAFDTVFIYEAAVRASHATVLGLHKINNEVIPLLKSDSKDSRRTEIADDPYLAELQRGIIDFASSFSLADKLYPAIPMDYLKPYALTCISLVSRFPSYDHYSWLAGVGNVADLGTDHINVAGADISPGFSFRSFELIKHSPWKEFVAYNKLGILGLLAILVYKNNKIIPDKNAGLVPTPLFDFPDTSSSISESKIKESNSIVFSNFLFNLAEKSHLDASKLGQQLSTQLSPRELYSIDRLIGYNYIFYRVVNIFLKLKGKHQYFYNGLSFKYTLKRRVYVFKRIIKDYIKYIRT